MNPTTLDNQKQLFGHPVGLYVLFMTELWERFSYYGMRAILVLYMIESASAENAGLGWENGFALSIYGWYTMLVYVASIPGGILADKFIGQKNSVMVGGFLLVAGHGVLAIDAIWAFYTGLGLIILGVGCLKPNISTMVGGLYKQGDLRRDQGFYIFYIGINVGAFLSSIIVGVVAKVYGWHYGFGLAGIGMLLGQVVYIYGQRFLKGIGDAPSAQTGQSTDADTSLGALFRRLFASPTQLVITLLLAVGGIAGGFFISEGGEAYAYALLFLFVAIVAGILMMVYKDINKIEKDRFIVLLLSFLIVIVFWGAFEQAGGLMNIYTEDKIDRDVALWIIDILFIAGAGFLFLKGIQDTMRKKDTNVVFLVLGAVVAGFYAYFRFALDTADPYNVPTAVFQSVNAFFIMIFATVVGSFWIFWQRRGKESSSLFKMAIGTIIMGIGFLFMAQASNEVQEYGDKAALILLILAYLFHTLGELCASPVALSFITKIAPVKYVSLMMGVYFAATGFGKKVAGFIGESSQAEPIKIEIQATPEQLTNYVADTTLAQIKDFEIVANIHSGGEGFVLQKDGANISDWISVKEKSTSTLDEFLGEYENSANQPLTAILKFSKDEEASDNEKDLEKAYSGKLEIFEVQDDKEMKTFLTIFGFTVAFSVLLLLFLKRLKKLTHGAEDLQSEEKVSETA